MSEKEVEGMDYDERFEEIRRKYVNINRMAADLEKNLKYITDNKHIIKQLITKNSTNSIPLEQSKHKKFLVCITGLADIFSKWDQYAEFFLSNSALKPAVQRFEAALKENDISLQTLESKVAELQELSKDVDQISERRDCQSL